MSADIIAEAERLCAAADEFAKAFPREPRTLLSRSFHLRDAVYRYAPYDVYAEGGEWPEATLPHFRQAQAFSNSCPAFPALAKATRALLAENARLRGLLETSDAIRLALQAEAAADQIYIRDLRERLEAVRAERDRMRSVVDAAIAFHDAPTADMLGATLALQAAIEAYRGGSR